MGVASEGGCWGLGALDFEKCFSLSFESQGKLNLATVGSSGKMLLATTWKNTLLPPPGKNPSHAQARLCVDQSF